MGSHRRDQAPALRQSKGTAALFRQPSGLPPSPKGNVINLRIPLVGEAFRLPPKLHSNLGNPVYICHFAGKMTGQRRPYVQDLALALS